MTSARRSIPAILLLALFPACGGEPRPPPEIRIGLLALLSGLPKETSGTPSMEGAELAAREANASGGVSLSGVRHRVTLIVEAYEDRPDSATSVARALINQSRIDVLVGPQFSRHAIPVALVAEDAQIPMLSPMSSSPATTEGKRFVFRLAFIDDVQAEVLGRFAAEELGASRAAVLYDRSTEYSRSLAKSFRRAFERTAPEPGKAPRVVAFESFARDEPLDYRTPIGRIAEARPDVLFLPNDAERVQAQIHQAREHGLQATLLGADTWDLERFRGFPGSEGSYVAHQWHPDLDTPEAVRFRRAYREAYGHDPKATAAMTYDSVRLLLEVLEQEGKLDPHAIRDGLARTRSFTGATGTIRYENGPNPRRKVVIARILEGRSRLHRVIDPPADP